MSLGPPQPFSSWAKERDAAEQVDVRWLRWKEEKQ